MWKWIQGVFINTSSQEPFCTAETYTRAVCIDKKFNHTVIWTTKPSKIISEEFNRFFINISS